jgi:16S rRNA (guanine527-N7)-methyltransferase
MFSYEHRTKKFTDYKRYNSAMQKQLLEKYVAAVMAAPGSLSLTATRDPAEFWERHVLDALKILSLLPASLHEKPLKVMDVGSGNGIPGIPVAIAAPNWDVYLLDANSKKIGFLDMFCKFNDIKNVHTIADRSESAARLDAYRGQFDLCFARALGKLPTALELCLPFLKPNGLLMIPHGESHAAELARSIKALKELGAALKEKIPYQVNREIHFTALTFLKTETTPDRYPRKSGMPAKRPL